jgi:hypothetical protein
MLQHCKVFFSSVIVLSREERIRVFESSINSSTRAIIKTKIDIGVSCKSTFSQAYSKMQATNGGCRLPLKMHPFTMLLKFNELSRLIKVLFAGMP